MLAFIRSKHLESLQNQEWARFLRAIKKIDGTNIVFHYKLRDKLFGEHYFNQKNRYVINQCVVCNPIKKSSIYLLDIQMPCIMYKFEVRLRYTKIFCLIYHVVNIF